MTALLTDDMDSNLRNLRWAGLNQGFETLLAEDPEVNKTAGDRYTIVVEASAAAQEAFALVLPDLPSTASIQWRTPATFLNESQEIDELLILSRPLLSERIADRLAYLHSLDDDLEPDQAPISAGSQKNFMQFMISRRQFTDPSIGVTPDGYIQAEWHLDKDNHFVIQFLPNGYARYVAVAPNSSKPEHPKRMSGFLPFEEVLKAVSPARVTDWVHNEG